MDKDLLGTLYRTYQKEIYLYLYSLCKNTDVAEDLTQETFLKALLSLPNSHTNMRAWLYLVARNLYFNHHKKELGKVPLEEAPEPSDAKAQALLDKMIADENRQLLYLALQNLESRKREILLMQYFGGLRQREIAAILHLTPENVRVLGYRAKRELKSYLEVNGYDIS